MLKIGDKPVDFSLTKYGSGTLDFNQTGYTGKVTLLTFIDITNSWDWLYYLLKLRAELSLTDVDIIAIIFNSTGAVTSAMIDSKFPPPAGTGTERRFTRTNLTTTTGLTVLIDNTWVSSIAQSYGNGFTSGIDNSFNGGVGTTSWSFLISKDFYITDKWSTNCTTNIDPVSFNQLNNYIATLSVAGTFVSGNTARIALDGLGAAFAGNYIDIAYGGSPLVYTYTVSAAAAAKVFPVTGTTASALMPITIEFSADTPAAGVAANYTLSGTAAGFTISSLFYETAFNSAAARFGAVQRYVKKRIDNLLAAPHVLKISPSEGLINGLSQVKVTFSKPVGTIVASGDALLDITSVKTQANYAITGGATTAPGSLAFAAVNPILYENNGRPSVDPNNVGKIENIVTLNFSAALTDSHADKTAVITINNITDTAGGVIPVAERAIDYNYDGTPPSITLSHTPTNPTNGTVTINSVIDDGTGSGVAVKKYASGSQTIAFFTSGGTVLAGTSFTTAVNGTFTVYAIDNAGNAAVNTITISNIDTVFPDAFTTGAVTPRGGTEVAGIWNTTNTSLEVVVPVANDSSLDGGTVQIQVSFSGGAYANLGGTFAIAPGEVNTNKTVNISRATFIAMAGFASGVSVSVRGVIADNASNATTGGASASVITVASSAKSITSFVINTVTGTINNTTHTVAVAMPDGTVLTSLTPTIAVSTGATITPASGTAQNFSSPVTYTVTAQDLSTQTYTVTATITPGVYVRDDLTDTGAVPHTGGCQSPDIIIWPSIVASADLAATFPDVNTPYGGGNIEIGNDNYIYIRVLNALSTPANVTARLYYAYLGTTCAPDQWTLIQDGIAINNIPGLGHKVSDAITWDAPDPGALGFDHFCLIAEVSTSTEPYPDNSGVTDAMSYISFIKNHNNVAYKNYTFENSVDDSSSKRYFMVRGLEKPQNIDLEINTTGIPRESYAAVVLPDRLAGLHPLILENVRLDTAWGVPGERRYIIAGNTTGIIGGINLKPNTEHRLGVELVLPPKVKEGRYNLPVIQRAGKEMMGAINVAMNVIALERAKFIGDRSTHLVHKNGCKHIAAMKRDDMVPYNSLREARTDGYDWALDCLNEPFTAKDISGRMRLKILKFMNDVNTFEVLDAKIKDTPGIGYFKGKHGKAEKKGIGITRRAAGEIFKVKKGIRKFTKLEEIENVTGIGKDTFIDIVNSFKQAEAEIVAVAGKKPGKRPAVKKAAVKKGTVKAKTDKAEKPKGKAAAAKVSGKRAEVKKDAIKKMANKPISKVKAKVKTVVKGAVQKTGVKKTTKPEDKAVNPEEISEKPMVKAVKPKAKAAKPKAKAAKPKTKVAKPKVKAAKPKAKAVKKTAVKKTAAKKTAVKKTAVKKTAAKKTAVKKTAVKKTAVKKAAVKKTAAKKTAVKKTAVKKSAVKAKVK